MKEKMVGFLIALAVVISSTTIALAECPEGKEPVDISTPSGITKTLCIPAAAVKGIENAAEQSGGTIVASGCPCFSLEDIKAIDAIYDLTCISSGQYDADGNTISSTTTCKGYDPKLVSAKVSISYDTLTVNRCYYYAPADKITGTPEVTIDEIITESEYDTCSSNLTSVVSPPK